MPYRRFPGLRVLIVDDDPVTGSGLEGLYRDWGWKAEWAASGEAGLIKAPLFEPDVVVLDYYLPDMVGTEFAARLAAVCGKAAPLVVAFTAAWGPDLEKIRAAGLRVVEKPKDPAELAAALEGAVAHGG